MNETFVGPLGNRYRHAAVTIEDPNAKRIEDEVKELKRMVEALWYQPPNGPGFKEELKGYS